MAKTTTPSPISVGDIVRHSSASGGYTIGQVAEIDDPAKVAAPKVHIVPACTITIGENGVPTMIVAQTHGPFPFDAADIQPI